MTTQTASTLQTDVLPKPKRALREFALYALLMIVLGMFATGAWLTSQIRDGIIQHTSFTSAVFMERNIQPLIRDLRTASRLSTESIQNLDKLVRQRLMSEHVLSVKIWTLEGSIAYSANHGLIGKRYPIEESLEDALAGQYAAEYGSLLADENEYERTLHKNLIEIYVPMFDDDTGRVFAVSEFYVDANSLPADLQKRYYESWMVVGLITGAMLVPLFIIIRRSDKTIGQQEKAIQLRMEELSTLLAENRNLQSNVERANRLSADLNEKFLNRLGADLHDGPVQLLAAATLRLDCVSPVGRRTRAQQLADQENIQLTRSAVNDVLREVRFLAAGLVLPELANRTLSETLKLAVDSHIMRTKKPVALRCAALPALSSETLNSALYRFVQEGLNNSSRHASGTEQQVSAYLDGNVLTVEVIDKGIGFRYPPIQEPSGHLGLSGLLHRITAIGGNFNVISKPGAGTTLRASINIESFVAQPHDRRKGAVT